MTYLDCMQDMKYMLIDISLINCSLDVFELSIWLKNVSLIFLTGFPLKTQFFPEFSYPCKSRDIGRFLSIIFIT